MKKIWKLLSLVIIFLLFVAAANPVSAQTASIGEEAFSPEEIIVKFSPRVSSGQIGKINQQFQTRIKEQLTLPHVFTLRVPKGFEEKLAKIYNSLSMVEYAEPNFVARAQFVPNDPYFANQWGLAKIKSPEAWDLTNGSSVVKIAILDTGIDKDHPDLATKVVARINLTSARSDDDLNGHGTHVAGIAAAITNNGLGVAGTGFNTALMSVKVLDDKGSGYYSWVINGLKWAADNGAKVINLSLGGGSSSAALEEAVNYAWNKGVVLSCAAGNSGVTTPLYPAYYQNCLAVAATDANDQKTSWSNYGGWVDLASPGLDIFSTLPNHKAKITNTRNYGSLSGTSMATPFVSGLAGLLFGEDSILNNSQVRKAIEETADKISGTGTYWGKGRINAYQAVSSIESQVYLSPTPTEFIGPTVTPTGIEPTNTPLPPTVTPTAIPPTPTLTLTPTPLPTGGTPTPTPIPWRCRIWPKYCQ